MLSLYEYNQVEKKPITVKLLGRNISLTKPDYVVSDIDGSFTIIVKNVKAYFHQRYDKLTSKIKNEHHLNNLEKYYVIDNEPAFYYLFPLIDDADKEIYHLLNRLGIPQANQDLIKSNGNLVKKNFYEETTKLIKKIFDTDYLLNPKYIEMFNDSQGEYSKIIYDNFDDDYDITIDDDISKYNGDQLFDYYNKLLDQIIDKTLHIYRNALLLLVIDYIKEKDESFNDIYNTITKKDFINSFYKVETTKNYARSMMSNIFKYPFVIGNYYNIYKFIEEDDFEGFKNILDYLDIINSITDTLNIENHNYIANNFSLDNNIDEIRAHVKLYCYLCGEDVDTYIARHVLLIQKEEIDRMLSTIENEGDIKRLDYILEQIFEKNRKFEILFNKSCMTKSELNAIDRRINEQKSIIRQDNYYRTILFIVLIVFVFYEAYKILRMGL